MRTFRISHSIDRPVIKVTKSRRMRWAVRIARKDSSEMHTEF